MVFEGHIDCRRVRCGGRDATGPRCSVIRESYCERAYDSGGDAQKQKRIFLKREDLQPVFSFKIRGAYNKIKNLKKEELEKGIITASAGNHAQGVALSAKTLGIKAVVAMPVTTPKIKVEAVRRLGGDVVLVGENFDETAAYAKKRSIDDEMTFIPPFDEPYVIAGQGTCGVEILRQLPTAKAVFIPIGGGGLIAGVATYLKTIAPRIKIITPSRAALMPWRKVSTEASSLNYLKSMALQMELPSKRLV